MEGKKGKVNTGRFIRRKDFVQAMSDLQSRLELANSLGTQFEGARDLFKALGYKKNPRFADFLAMYERNPFAARVVDAVSLKTWRKFPVLIEGEIESDTTDEGKLTSLQVDFIETRDRLKLNEVFKTLDVNCGIGRFTLLFLGLADEGRNFSTEVKPFNGDADSSRLAYVQVYDEGQVVKILDYETKTDSPRFGLPLTYSINMGDPQKKDQRKYRTVHWSRVIHVAENKRRSRVFGTPRLLRLLNTLDDVNKVIGGSAEAFWLGGRTTFGLKAQDDAKAPEAGSSEALDLEDEIEKFVHQYRPYLMVEGFDIQEFKPSIVSPLNHFKVAMSALSGGASIPQKTLTGGERGGLGSDQDDKNFADDTSIRQLQFAEPDIARPFIDRMIELNVWHAPQEAGEKYKIKWPSGFELNDEEKADVAYKVGQTLAVVASAAEKVLPEEVFNAFLNKYFGFLGIENIRLRDKMQEDGKTKSKPKQEDGTDVQPVK